jgi:tetratricopeptide (TPR) repeat protein
MRIRSICVLLCGLPMLASSQEQVETLSRQARDAMAAGRYTEAVALYERMVKVLPNEPGAKLNLALALDAASRPSEAIRNLEQIKAAEAGNPRFWFLLGIEYQKIEQPAKAVEPLERAVQLAPGESDYRLELADAYLGSGALPQAAGAFHALSAERSDDPRFVAGLIRTELAISTEAYRALVKSGPESSYRLALEALSEIDKGDRTKSADLYRRAMATQPPAPWLKGEQSGAFDPAADTGHPLAQLFHRGDLEGVLAETAAAKTPEALYWRARASSELARALLTRLGELPYSPEAHELAGLALRQAGRWEDSVIEFREAVSLAPGDVRLQSELAKAYWLSRRYEDAAKLLQELIAHEPDRGDWEFELGDSLFNLGQPEQSLPHLRKAAALSPGDFSRQALLGRALLQMGQSAEAVPILEKAAQHDVDGSIHFQLAAAYRNVGRPDRARQAIARQKEIERRRSASDAISQDRN